MIAGSFHGTRTTGTVPLWEIACSIGQRSLKSLSPCCIPSGLARPPDSCYLPEVLPTLPVTGPSGFGH